MEPRPEDREPEIIETTEVRQGRPAFNTQVLAISIAVVVAIFLIWMIAAGDWRKDSDEVNVTVDQPASSEPAQTDTEEQAEEESSTDSTTSESTTSEPAQEEPADPDQSTDQSQQ